jgi:PIN domain nuclease of toxin-antitoxin system
VAEAVLDASALLALLRKEPGSEKVADVLTRSCISSVNLAETYGKMVEYGKPLEEVVYQVDRLRIPVIPFEAGQAEAAASFWKLTRSAGLSLGDRACMALALKTGAPAFTTEKEWVKCDVGVQMVKIR